MYSWWYCVQSHDHSQDTVIGSRGMSKHLQTISSQRINYYHCYNIISCSLTQDTTQHKTNLPLLLLTPAAWVPLHIDWPPPPSVAPLSYTSECSYPPPSVSVVSSSSPGGCWLLSGHLQVEISPIKWTHIHFEMSVLRQMRWEYTTVHWLSTITLVASCSHS